MLLFWEDPTNTTNCVGIGTTIPSAKLEVNGDISFNSMLRVNGNSGTSGDILTSQGAGSAPDWASGKSGLGNWTLNGFDIYNNNSGNIGINMSTGTTPPNLLTIQPDNNSSGGLSVNSYNGSIQVAVIGCTSSNQGELSLTNPGGINQIYFSSDSGDNYINSGNCRYRHDWARRKIRCQWFSLFWKPLALA